MRCQIALLHSRLCLLVQLQAFGAAFGFAPAAVAASASAGQGADGALSLLEGTRGAASEASVDASLSRSVEAHAPAFAEQATAGTALALRLTLTRARTLAGARLEVPALALFAARGARASAARARLRRGTDGGRAFAAPPPCAQDHADERPSPWVGLRRILLRRQFRRSGGHGGGRHGGGRHGGPGGGRPGGGGHGCADVACRLSPRASLLPHAAAQPQLWRAAQPLGAAARPRPRPLLAAAPAAARVRQRCAGAGPRRRWSRGSRASGGARASLRLRPADARRRISHISPYLPISPQQTRAAVPAKQSVAKEARGERLAAATAFAQECAVARLEACLRLLSPPDQPPGLLSHAACEIAPLLSVAVADWMREAAACVPPEGA